MCADLTGPAWECRVWDWVWPCGIYKAMLPTLSPCRPVMAWEEGNAMFSRRAIGLALERGGGAKEREECELTSLDHFDGLKEDGLENS